MSAADRSEFLQREDLSMELDGCGTGLGQVLAILYVLCTAYTPYVILVDEPQSFLHPDAIRKLMSVMAQFPQHQYVLTTHSPAIISACSPSTIYLLKLEGPRSVALAVDPADHEALKAVLAEVGARMSDVFGAEQVIWLEGRTEELAFPAILDKLCPGCRKGCLMLGVESTGDFQRKDRNRWFYIYNRLADGSGLLPPATGFVLDRERRSPKDIEDIERAARGRAVFLRRRQFENYLLDAEAIAAVANDIEGFGNVTTEQVQAWLDDKRASQYLADGEDWDVRTDAATVLSELFAEFSETRVAYRKTEHSVSLSNWLLAHKPDKLSEIADLLLTCIKGVQAIPQGVLS